MSFPSDLAIAQSVTPRPIAEVAAMLDAARRTAREARLERALAELIADPALGHPVHWAPFLLIGNWL